MGEAWACCCLSLRSSRLALVICASMLVARAGAATAPSCDGPIVMGWEWRNQQRVYQHYLFHLPGVSADSGAHGDNCSEPVAPPVLKMKISLALSMDEFTPSVQESVLGAISAAAGVDPTKVRILSVEAVARRRRLLAGGIALEISIDAPPGGSILDEMTVENLNRELGERGLPPATILEPPIIVYAPIEQMKTSSSSSTTPSPTTTSTTPAPTTSSTTPSPTTSSTTQAPTTSSTTPSSP